jgi:RNA polymerase sigma-70 factor (ECF subfamily)
MSATFTIPARRRPPELVAAGQEGHPRAASPRLLHTSDAAPDHELLAASAAGDAQAFHALYRRHAPWLLARLSRRCADGSQVDEVLQDTFVAVWRGASRWDGRGQVPAWMWGIASRRLVDSLRRRPRATTLLSELPEMAGPRAASAEDQALLALEFGPLRSALNRLSPEMRLVLEVTVLHGLSTREASRLLGIPVGTVKTRMMRARAVLRGQLTPAEPQADIA